MKPKEGIRKFRVKREKCWKRQKKVRKAFEKRLFLVHENGSLKLHKKVSAYV